MGKHATDRECCTLFSYLIFSKFIPSLVIDAKLKLDRDGKDNGLVLFRFSTVVFSL